MIVPNFIKIVLTGFENFEIFIERSVGLKKSTIAHVVKNFPFTLENWTKSKCTAEVSWRLPYHDYRIVLIE